MKLITVQTAIISSLLGAATAQAEVVKPMWTVQLVPISSADDVVGVSTSAFDERLGTITRTMSADRRAVRIVTGRISYVSGFDANGRPIVAHVETGIGINIDPAAQPSVTVRYVSMGEPRILNAGSAGSTLVPGTYESTVAGTLPASRGGAHAEFQIMGTLGGVDQPAYLVRVRPE